MRLRQKLEHCEILLNELMEVLMDFNQRVKDATAKVVADEAQMSEQALQIKSLQEQLATASANTVLMTEVMPLVDAVLGPYVAPVV